MCVLALLLGTLAGCTTERTPLAPDRLLACLAVPDSTVWQVVDTAAFVAGVQRCLAALAHLDDDDEPTTFHAPRTDASPVAEPENEGVQVFARKV